MADKKQNWVSEHRVLTVIIGAIILIIIASSGGQKSNNSTSQPSASTPSQATQQVVKKVEVKSPDPIALSGQGQQASDKFTLGSGLAVFQLTHNGSSNFGVWLKDSKGQNVELLANEIGSLMVQKPLAFQQANTFLMFL